MNSEGGDDERKLLLNYITAECFGDALNLYCCIAQTEFTRTSWNLPLFCCVLRLRLSFFAALIA